ncbi:hypothetical protein BO82DRAFT_365727 [Aspergillus uvarum CBS 121591]|uniref:Uncharacterized protein n=1 Tax=Aspergillus uvarum CBS 121591 TaxID=1448315 RepID=A0A319DME8_9EURO|nr:hypothetical protein BO82DRAFT_365727 [Aspergillus uvarum CBS 121591]PYH80572.1 hypothetical protein BO82DRAFT_365727 [Aspergillus uvarum CBS 121591]
MSQKGVNKQGIIGYCKNSDIPYFQKGTWLKTGSFTGLIKVLKLSPTRCSCKVFLQSQTIELLAMVIRSHKQYDWSRRERLFRVCYETADELCTPTTVVSLMGSLDVWRRFVNMRWYCNRHGYDVIILWEMSTLQIRAALEAPQAVTVPDVLQAPGALQAIHAHALQILQAEMHALQAEAEVLQDLQKLEEQQESKSVRAQQARQRLEKALPAHRQQAIKARQAQRSRRLRQTAQVRQANQAQQEEPETSTLTR